MTVHERRRTEGYCNRCGKELTDGFKNCPECRKVIREYMRVRIAQCGEIGLCVNCQQREARPGKQMCFQCAVIISQRNYERRHKLMEANI